MLVFLDVDGTLADHGVVPEAHVDAVRQARANGHRVLLCTGRSACMLPAQVMRPGFDGVVASAGAYVKLGDHVLRDRRFPPELARKAVGILDANKVTYVLEGPEMLQGPADIAVRLSEVFGRMRTRDGQPRKTPEALGRVKTGPDIDPTDFTKITVFESDLSVEDLGALIGPEVETLPSSIPITGTSAGEIFMADEHKAVGAQLVVDELGVDMSEVVAVGDGYNDLEVIAWAGIGVAIEGAPDEVLAVANMTTPGPENAGLAILFEKLGLTGPNQATS